MTASRIVLLRHGRTGHNAGGVWQGQLDIPLDDVGRLQAADAASCMAVPGRVALERDEPVTVVSSDLVRARDTAAPLAESLGLPVTDDARLREVNAGSWQGLTRAEIAEAGMGAELEAWQRGEDVRLGGGETRSEAADRAGAAVLEHAKAQDGGVLYVVAHGGVLRGVVLVTVGLPSRDWNLLGGLGNCRCADLGPHGSAWRLLGYNAREPVPLR